MERELFKSSLVSYPIPKMNLKKNDFYRSVDAIYENSSGLNNIPNVYTEPLGFKALGTCCGRNPNCPFKRSKPKRSVKKRSVKKRSVKKKSPVRRSKSRRKKSVKRKSKKRKSPVKRRSKSKKKKSVKRKSRKRKSPVKR